MSKRVSAADFQNTEMKKDVSTKKVVKSTVEMDDDDDDDMSTEEESPSSEMRKPISREQDAREEIRETHEKIRRVLTCSEIRG